MTNTIIGTNSGGVGEIKISITDGSLDTEGASHLIRVDNIKLDCESSSYGILMAISNYVKDLAENEKAKSNTFNYSWFSPVYEMKMSRPHKILHKDNWMDNLKSKELK